MIRSTAIDREEFIDKVLGFNFDSPFSELVFNMGLGDREVHTWYLIATLFNSASEDSDDILSLKCKENILSIAQDAASDIESSIMLGDDELSPIEDLGDGYDFDRNLYTSYILKIHKKARQLIAEDWVKAQSYY